MGRRHAHFLRVLARNSIDPTPADFERRVVAVAQCGFLVLFETSHRRESIALQLPLEGQIGAGLSYVAVVWCVRTNVIEVCARDIVVPVSTAGA